MSSTSTRFELFKLNDKANENIRNNNAWITLSLPGQSKKPIVLWLSYGLKRATVKIKVQQTKKMRYFIILWLIIYWG